MSAANSIDAILQGPDRYSAESIPELEAFLKKQVEGSAEYHFDANLSLLKLYTFYPKRHDITHTSETLFLALMSLPSTDFLQSTYLIPEKTLSEEPVVSICKLATHLELARFKAFWTETEQNAALRPLLDKLPRFSARIRQFIIGVLSATYQTIGVETLCEAVNCTVAQLSSLSPHPNWTVTGSTASFPITDDNQAKPKKATETVTLTQLSKVLSSLNQ